MTVGWCFVLMVFQIRRWSSAMGFDLGDGPSGWSSNRGSGSVGARCSCGDGVSAGARCNCGDGVSAGGRCNCGDGFRLRVPCRCGDGVSTGSLLQPWRWNFAWSLLKLSRWSFGGELTLNGGFTIAWPEMGSGLWWLGGVYEWIW